MKRRLFNILSLLSMMLLTLLTLAWLESYFASRHFRISQFLERSKLGVVVVSGNGGLGISPRFRGGIALQQQPDQKHADWNSRITHMNRWTPAVYPHFGVIRALSPANDLELAAPSIGFQLIWLSDPVAGWQRASTMSITAPYPVWMLAPAIMPALWLRRQVRTRMRARREANHCCVTCGYDLRASAGTCPECGTAIISTGRSAGAQLPIGVVVEPAAGDSHDRSS